ncbi:MAG: RNA polymerase Rpb4 family protein [Thermoplasmata archaeon]
MSDEEGKPVLLAEVRKLIEEETTEENRIYEQRLALQHAQLHSPLSVEKGKALVKELMKLEKVNEPTAVKIADMLPTHPDDVRAIFAKERFTLMPEEIEAILRTVARYM